MKVLKNRKVAVVITFFMILLSTIFGFRNSLIDMRENINQVFYNGINNNGKGIQNDLEYISNQCYNLTVVASRYISEDDKKIQDIIGYQKLVGMADSPSIKYKTMEQLIESSMNLQAELKKMQLDSRDEYYCTSFPINIKSRMLMISHNVYNDKVISFNKVLKQFPTSILSKLTFVKPLELFQ